MTFSRALDIHKILDFKINSQIFLKYNRLFDKNLLVIFSLFLLKLEVPVIIYGKMDSLYEFERGKNDA